MATVLNKTDKLLTEVLREVREVRSLVEPISRAIATQKKGGEKLPAGLKQALREVKEGNLVGPFHSVSAFMAGLRR